MQGVRLQGSQLTSGWPRTRHRVESCLTKCRKDDMCRSLAVVVGRDCRFDATGAVPVERKVLTAHVGCPQHDYHYGEHGFHPPDENWLVSCTLLPTFAE